MNVLYLMPAEGFGGAERQGLIHIRWMRMQGNRVTAVVGKSPAMVSQLEESEQDTLWLDSFPPALPNDSSVSGALIHASHWFGGLRRFANLLAPVVEDRKIDVIVANRTFAWVLGAALHRRTGTPFVIRAGSRPRMAFLAPAARLMDQFGATPTLLISNCRAVEAALAPHINVPRMIVPNAVDLEQFRPRNTGAACRRLGLDCDRRRVALAIRPSADKGMELLFEVARRTRIVYPDIEFVIAGDYHQRSRYMAAAERANLVGCVKFLGHIDNVADLYATCQLALLTSPADSIEGSPNALLEAMACQRPVVATAVGGIPELISNGQEGFLVPDDQPQQAVEAILRLMHDEALRDQMGNAGHRRARTKHAPRFIVRRMMKRIARHVVVGS